MISKDWLVEVPKSKGMRRLYRATVIPYINHIFKKKVLKSIGLDFDYYGVVFGMILSANENDNENVRVYGLQEFIEQSPEYVDYWTQIVTRLKLNPDDIDFTFNDLLLN